jgi:transposase
MVVLASSRGSPPTEIARSMHASPEWVRDVIHAFNRDGLRSLRPRWGGGRPRQIDEAARARITAIAKTHPQLMGEPYACWSLSRLRAHLLRRNVVRAISEERLRQILADEGVSIQATKGWKRSPDPDFDAKAARVQALYAQAEAGRAPGAVVCFDEHGPVAPVPRPGRAWAARGLPRRIRANYRKPHGVRFFFGAYDVGADQLFGRWFPNKGAANVIATLAQIRRRYPAHQRVFVVQDNLSAHWTAEVLEWAAAHNVELVPTPTYASWLNRIEAEFGVMVGAVFAGSDYRDHDEVQAAVGRWLRRRNGDARRHFAERRAERERRRLRRARARRRMAAAA